MKKKMNNPLKLTRYWNPSPCQLTWHLLTAWQNCRGRTNWAPNFQSFHMGVPGDRLPRKVLKFWGCNRPFSCTLAKILLKEEVQTFYTYLISAVVYLSVIYVGRWGKWGGDISLSPPASLDSVSSPSPSSPHRLIPILGIQDNDQSYCF